MKSVKNPIKVNFANGTIVISKSFSVKASVVGTKEYLALTDVQNSYPDYQIEVREIKKNSNKETYYYFIVLSIQHHRLQLIYNELH